MADSSREEIEEFVRQVNITRKLEITIQLPRPARIWILQGNGWFVPQPGLAASTIVPDRNVLAALKRMSRDGYDNSNDDHYWLKQLDAPGCQFHCVTAAFEGKWRAAPTFEQFREEFEAGAEVVRDALPKATIVEFDDAQLRSIFGLAINRHDRYAAECLFLQDVSSILANRVSSKQLLKTEASILDAATSRRVPPTSFVVLAALSCLYESEGDSEKPSIGRGVIKPKPVYSLEDAHNAASDIAALEFLAMMSLVHQKDVGLCTKDLPLFLLWTHARLTSGEAGANGFPSVQGSPHPDLFPRLEHAAMPAFLDRIRKS